MLRMYVIQFWPGAHNSKVLLCLLKSLINKKKHTYQLVEAVILIYATK